MLPMWVLAFPIWLVVFIVLYALATLYFAIKYREFRKFLAGAFFVSSGTLVSVGHWRIASDCVAIRRDRFC